MRTSIESACVGKGTHDMNRKLLIRVTTPTIVIGLVLFGTCLVSAWYVHRLQANLASILSENVTSLEAAQELEIRVRQLRFHCFLYLIDPTPVHREPIEQDHENFEAALRVAHASAITPEELRCVQQIEEGYRQYHSEIDQLLATPPQDASRAALANLVDSHPVRHVVEPSQELLRVNKQMMESTRQESQRVAHQALFLMILIGVVGPVSGLITGYGVARGLSRSIYQLSVRVRDMAHRLERDVASVSIEADGDLENLDRQLQQVVQQVEEVTERQQQHQRDMLRAEQLAAVGQLAASVAHEVRNPLTSVKMLVELAVRPRDPKPLTFSDLRVIHREITRLEHTVQSFLDFAKLPQPQRTACDLREVLAEAIGLVEARAKQQKVAIAMHRPDQAVPVAVDRGQFCTVIVNLCLNALDAMPHGGRMELNLQRSDANEIALAVNDSGCGIVPEMSGRLFTPFASTKATGTGLGLSLSRRIVEEHGGHVTAENRPEGGASFTIWLPADLRSAFTKNDLVQNSV
jgi:two-component system, NtrC family, sensor histidine kinase HydH